MFQVVSIEGNLATESKTYRAKTKWLRKEVLKQPKSPLSTPNNPYNLTTAKDLPSHFRHKRPIPRLDFSQETPLPLKSVPDTWQLQVPWTDTALSQRGYGGQSLPQYTGYGIFNNHQWYSFLYSRMVQTIRFSLLHGHSWGYSSTPLLERLIGN